MKQGDITIQDEAVSLPIPKIGEFTRDMSAATASVSYTGVGFKPSAIHFFAGLSATIMSSYNGFDDGTTHCCLFNNYAYAAGVGEPTSGWSIVAKQAGATTQSGKISTMDADGFTISWEKDGTPSANTLRIFYMAVK